MRWRDLRGDDTAAGTRPLAANRTGAGWHVRAEARTKLRVTRRAGHVVAITVLGEKGGRS